MTDHLRLAERVEQASGPDRELDISICTDALGKTRLDDGFQTAPHFTASLDAALTLVPEGYNWTVEGDGFAELEWFESPVFPLVHAYAATPALALCAAALKARSQAGEG